LESITEGIEAIYETAGEVDLIIMFHTQTDVELKNALELIRAIKHIKSTKTHVVLNKSDPIDYIN